MDDALDGLSGGVPKKSSPPNSWDGCCCCFDGGGCRVETMEARDGGVISSPPIRSNTAGPDFGGGTGSDVPEDI